MKKLVSRLFIYLNILSATALLLAYLSAHISPENFTLLPFFGLGYAFLLVVNVFFAVFWLVQRKWWLMLSLLVVLAGWRHLQNFVQLNFDKQITDNQNTSFKLLSFNVRLFDYYNWTNNQGTRHEILNFIDLQEADLLCLQEFYSNPAKNINTIDSILQFNENQQQHVAFAEHEGKKYNFGIATFSRFPITGRGEIRFPNTFNVCIYSDIAVNTDTFRLYNTHLQSIKFGYDDYNFIDSINYKDEKQRLRGIWSIAKKLRHAYIKRAQQVDTLLRHINTSPFPVIVCGDFNDTPVSYAYYQLRDQRLDAFVQSGNGTGETYAGLLPAFRIDYILHDTIFHSHEFHTFNTHLSDHYPISCWLTIRE